MIENSNQTTGLANAKTSRRGVAMNGTAINETAITISFETTAAYSINEIKKELKKIYPKAVPNFVGKRIYVPGKQNFVQVRDNIARLPGIYSVALSPSSINRD